METAAIFFGIAIFLLAAIVTFAVLSRINEVEEVDEVEPLGDMVDIKHILNKYGD